MRVGVFSLGPVFPRHVHGGSQRTLVAVVRHLAAAGHQCDIYCTRRDDNFQPFELAPGARVHPILPFKQTFPEPYYTAPYHLASIARTLRTAATSAEVFYMHDSELVLSAVYDDVAAVSGVQDFVYPTTLEGVFAFRGRQLIAISGYVGACMAATLPYPAGSDAPSVQVVPNGFDVTAFSPVDPSALASELGLRPDWLPILFPHRPDPRKGLVQAISVIDALRAHLPADLHARLRLLVPRWVDSDLVGDDSGHEYQTLYGAAQQRAADLGLGSLLHLHPWVPADRMPEYYSLGAATLCIGNFVEAFGNVSVESQLCGTPAIVSRVGAQRTVIPDELIAKVDYGDIGACAEALAKILLADAQFDRARFSEFVQTAYSEAATVAGYQEVLSEAAAGRSSGTPLGQSAGPGGYAIPPWCALTSSGYYSDYLYGYADEPELESLLRTASAAGPAREAPLGKVAQWAAQGLLVPAVGQPAAIFHR